MFHNPYYPDLDLDHLGVGDRVRLLYTGGHRVPLCLAYTWATIEGFTARGLLIIRAEGETRVRRIRRDQEICAVEQGRHDSAEPLLRTDSRGPLLSVHAGL